MIPSLIKYGICATKHAKDANAAALASLLLKEHSTNGPLIRSQYLDVNQLQRLSATLASHSLPDPSSTFAVGSSPDTLAIPPCHHLVYFTPPDAEDKLGLDGSDTIFNPPGSFTRRMWAGGELEWVDGNKLVTGEKAEETTTLKSAEVKKTKAGDEMIVVGVEKTFKNSKGLALVDRRNWLFRQAIDFNNPPPLPPLPSLIPVPSVKYEHTITHTPISLFRFSALTFNAHKIHYDRDWCRKVEGHRDCVVHGPLNLIHMVDFWRHMIGKSEGGTVNNKLTLLLPKKVTYRATSPFYVGEEYRILMEEEKDKVCNMKIVDWFGIVGMVGKIERW
ncbi:hypothetical protein EAE96_007624 [Botrytis aclada]|nr:hypothetical protein EAE96_007624 [Botrytis aclada]